jgi:hypothetical protein
MKKLLQICLIAVLVLVLFQAFAAEGAMASAHNDGVTAGRTVSTLSASAEGAHQSACLIRIKGLPCVIPNVGWNS